MYMKYITTTQLRTETPELITMLMSGQNIDLIHRSQIIGEIRPKKVVKPKLFNAKRFAKIVEKLNFIPLTNDQIEKRYRSAMTKKHGKYIY